MMEEEEEIMQVMAGEQSQIDGEKLINHYKSEFIRPSTRYLVIGCVIILCFYFGLNVVIFKKRNATRESLQSSYLTSLNLMFEEHMKHEFWSQEIFLNIWREAFDVPWNFTSFCDSEYYYCNSSATQYPDLEFLWPILKASFQIVTHGKVEAYSIFSFTQSDLWVYTLGESFSQIDEYAEWGRSQTMNSYVSTVVKEGEQKFNIFCTCTDTDISICFKRTITPLSVFSTGNLAYYDSPSEETYWKSLFEFPSYAVEVDAEEVEYCMSLFESSKVVNSVIKCPTNKKTNIFVPKLILTKVQFSIKTRYYRESMAEGMVSTPITFSFYILSNQTYYSTHLTEFRKAVNQVLTLSQVMVYGCGLWMLILGFSIFCVRNHFYYPLVIMLKLARIVKQFKHSNDQNKIQMNLESFDLLVSENTDKLSIFLSTLSCLRYFLWYYQWFNEKCYEKKKQLLEKGMDLFQSREYAPVLIYIHQNQIKICKQNINFIRKLLKVPQNVKYSEKEIKQLKQKSNDSENENEQKLDVSAAHNLVAQQSKSQENESEHLKKSLSSQIEQTKKQGSQEFHRSLNSLNLKSRVQETSKRQYMHTEYEIQDQSEKNLEFMQMNSRQLMEQLENQYHRINDLFDKMIEIKKNHLEKQEPTEVESSIKELYKMQIHRLQYKYKRIKFLYVRQEKLKKIYSLEKLQDIEHLSEDLSVKIQCLSRKIDYLASSLDVKFEQFKILEEKFELEAEMVQTATLYQIKLLKIVKYPLPYKQLESLCHSNYDCIKTEAKIILCDEFKEISPFGDLEICHRIREELLKDKKTTFKQKRKYLHLYLKILKEKEMKEQRRQVQLIYRFYNFKQKKYYFIADFSDQYDIFLNVLKKIYKSMDFIDMFEIHNLVKNDVDESISCAIKPRTLSQFQRYFQIFQYGKFQSKSRLTGKNAPKKITYQKDFNKILSFIQEDDHSMSKYIVLLLGGEQQSNNKTNQDVETSSVNNRQEYQKIYQQIINKMENNYFHNILIGLNLRDYLSKQGRIKKHVKLCHDLLEIDLCNANWEEQEKEIQKFLVKD